MLNILNGRLNRLQYFTLNFISVVLFVIMFFIITFNFKNISGVLFAFLLITFFISQLSIIVRRFHDINQSGFMSILLLAPMVNIVISLILLFKKGDPSENKYGPAIYNSYIYDTFFKRR